MKIICDNCRTKYSIADEKVKGKVFKIRCKKCSNIIVVRGNQQQDQQDEAQPSDGAYAGGGDYGEAPAWHLVVDQKQVGPMTGAEVRDRFARAEIDADTYVWREGFADWLRLAQVEEFADIAQATQVAPPSAGAYEEQQPGYGAESPQAWSADAGGGGQEAGWSGGEAAAPAAWSAPAAEGGGAASWSAPEAERSEGDNLFGGQMADDANRDLFASGHGQDAGPAYSSAAPEPASEGGLFGAPAASASASAGGGDLFGAPAGGNGQQLFSQEEEPQPAQAQMTGARNENSVLFSLTNLQALAMGGKGPAVAPSAGPAAPGGPSDGSGLIDIRVMASSPAPAAAAASGDGLPDLGGFAAPIAAAPVLIPAAGEERPKWLLPALIGGGVILVGAITALVLVLVLREPEQVVVASAAPTGQQVGVQQPTAPTAPAPTEKAEPKPASATDDTKTEKADEPKPTSTAGKRRRHGRRRPGGAHRRETSAPAEPARAPSRDRTPKKRDAIDDLIDGAIGGKKSSGGGGSAAARPKPRRTSDDSNLPETLTRAQIQAGMRNIKGKVQGCYDRYKVPGMANVQVRISTSGSVGSARVVGMFAGTPTGACVQAAAKSARFDRFKGSPITITYPFILR